MPDRPLSTLLAALRLSAHSNRWNHLPTGSSVFRVSSPLRRALFPRPSDEPSGLRPPAFNLHKLFLRSAYRATNRRAVDAYILSLKLHGLSHKHFEQVGWSAGIWSKQLVSNWHDRKCSTRRERGRDPDCQLLALPRKLCWNRYLGGQRKASV